MNCQVDDSHMQYMASLRGEPSGRGGQEMMKQGMRDAPENREEANGGGTEKVAVTAQIHENHNEVSRAYVLKLTGRGDKSSALGESTPELSCQSKGALHEKGKGNDGEGKQHEKEA